MVYHCNNMKNLNRKTKAYCCIFSGNAIQFVTLSIVRLYMHRKKVVLNNPVPGRIIIYLDRSCKTVYVKVTSFY